MDAATLGLGSCFARLILALSAEQRRVRQRPDYQAGFAIFGQVEADARQEGVLPGGVTHAGEEGRAELAGGGSAGARLPGSQIEELMDAGHAEPYAFAGISQAVDGKEEMGVTLASDGQPVAQAGQKRLL